MDICCGGPQHPETSPTTADRLVELQTQLHRLLSVAHDEHSGFDYVQEGLEAAKTFLGVLQTSLASLNDYCPDAAKVPAPSVSYIAVQQSLVCYSYVLLLLDRVVGVLTGSGPPVAHACAGTSSYMYTPSPLGESPAVTALSLGVFNLASQPALNVEMVLHLVLRMVQRLRKMIHLLASGCKDLAGVLDRPDRIPASSASGGEMHVSAVEADRGSSKKANGTPVSIAVMSYAVSDFIVERENALVGRLARLANSSGPD
jgi:hypothetical protein